MPGVGGAVERPDRQRQPSSREPDDALDVAMISCSHPGDLSAKSQSDVKGEILELENTINTMVDHSNAFASEVTRITREVRKIQNSEARL